MKIFCELYDCAKNFLRYLWLTIFLCQDNLKTYSVNYKVLSKDKRRNKLAKYLCRTTVKISFPDLRNELFVNILGYKEPNLIHLWRCKVFHDDHRQDDDDDDCEGAVR